MTDGLYRVSTKALCAGFVIEKGQVIACAPILKRKLDYWITVAVLVPSRHQEFVLYRVNRCWYAGCPSN